MPTATQTHYALIGAGPAGIAAAEAIRSVDPAEPLLMIHGEAGAPYCRPLIIELLTGERSADEIRLRAPQWYAERRIELLCGDPVTKLEIPAKRLVLASGRQVEWQKLLIATGAVPVAPPIAGLDRVDAFNLHREEDVARLRPLCKPGATALLVGIGLIGLQALTALKELGLAVIAVDVARKVLPMILDSAAAGYVQRRLEAHGVEVRTGTAIAEVGRANGAGSAYRARTKAGDQIDFDLLVLATGMKPDLALLGDQTITVHRGISVSPTMETSAPGVYAAGDVTEVLNWIEGRPEIHAHWVNASHQGRIAGLQMAGARAESYEPSYLNSMRIFGLPVITMGASRVDRPTDCEVLITDAPARPAYTRLVLKDGRLIAATFINDVKRAGPFQHLLRNKIDIGAVADALLAGGREGFEFLDALHEQAIRGEIDWPESMDLITKYRKDHSHTRWGKKKQEKQKT